MIKKDLILNELDRMIGNREVISFRKIGTNLNISPSTINYQFGNQETLYKEYFLYKVSNVLNSSRPTNFTDFIVIMFEFAYDFFDYYAKDLSFTFVKIVQEELLEGKVQMILELYKKEFGTEDRLKMLSIISFVMVFNMSKSNYMNFLDADTSTSAKRKVFISDVVQKLSL